MNWPDKLNNIVEICIALDIAILGIAYPIIVDKISTIGDKYSSLYISNVFENTFPQKKVGLVVNKKEYKMPLFRLLIYTTLSTFTFQIFEFNPLFDWDNWFINNSADLLVFGVSLLLIVVFFIWLNKVALFNGKSTSLLNELKARYYTSKEGSEIRDYCLKAINELTYYAIEKQDEHIQKTLLEFYYEVFTKIQKEYDRNQPIDYPIDLYEFVQKLNYIVVNVKNLKLRGIEHRAVSGLWLFGEGFESTPISNETYQWAWRNLCIICDNEKLVRMFWANSSQYFTYNLRQLDYQFDVNWGIQNEEQIKKRDKERKLFKDLHYALGGLLLYRKQYKTINYMFEYSQSDPPDYILLPDSMTTVFAFFDYFSDNYRELLPLDYKYPFPDLDNLGNSRMVVYWICSYITLLFVRQYTLVEQYVYQNHTSQPNMPDMITDLYRWQNNIPYFRKCLNDTISNIELLKELGFEKISEEKRKDFEIFLQTLETSIQERVKHIQEVAELSEEKLNAFETASKEIITNAFQQYDNLFNDQNYEGGEGDLRLSVLGGKTLYPKSAFTDDDIPHLNYHSFFAETIAKYNIEKYISNSFSVAKTKSYLLDRDNLKAGLERIISDTENVVIVGFNIGFQNQELLKSFHLNASFDTFIGGDFGEAMFILRRSDLPTIEHKNLNENEILQQQLKPLNEDLKVYYSIVDINQPENQKLRNLWPQNRLDGELKVQILISFFTLITWKSNRSVVQANIASPYREQGIRNELNDIEPL